MPRPNRLSIYSLFPSFFCLAALPFGNKIVPSPVTPLRTSERRDVLEGDDRQRFEATVLPHLDAAFNLARWLLRNPADAQDATQEALLRAVRFFSTYRSGNPRAWLLQIVRNCCYTWLQKQNVFEDLGQVKEASLPVEKHTPESLALANADRTRISAALQELPASFREILVLRELEGCSYKEIASITGRPIGTVMSALARARRQLRNALMQSPQLEAHREL